MSPTPLNLLRECQDRVFKTDGIPMVLALVSEVGDVPKASGPDVRADGQALSESAEDYRAALLPTARDDDMGALISVMQVVSYENFGRRVDL